MTNRSIERCRHYRRTMMLPNIDRYLLDEHDQPVPCADLTAWGEGMHAAKLARRHVVAQDKDESGQTEILVSTVFLFLNHNFALKGPPVLWETLVFGGLLDGEMNRYTSRDAAFAGHQAMCARVRESLPR